MRLWTICAKIDYMKEVFELKVVAEFSERFNELIDGKSYTQVGAEIGVSKQTVSAYINGSRSPKRPTVVAIASQYGVNPLWLMGYDVDKQVAPDSFSFLAIPGIEPMPKMSKIPLIGSIVCGTPATAEENIEDLIDLPDNVHADFALKCKGDSMILARIYDGDMVYIRQQPDVENGEIAAVVIDNESTLKRVYKFPDHLELRPENPTYPILSYTGPDLEYIRIIGKAVAFTGKVK